MKISVAGIQNSFTADTQENIEKTTHWVEYAAEQGANIILPSELFQSLYFCTEQEERWFDGASAVNESLAVRAMQKLARKLKVFIPCSFFERDGPHTYNSLAMIDDSGDVMGIYRKSHIPDGPGYQEKYYFKPGDSGFKVWSTKYGTIGVGICWDQWFPEAARMMMLKGADILLYPTAIGSEPYDSELDTSAIWRRAMQGHAASNAVPVLAANRIGSETLGSGSGLAESSQSYYGHSFIANETGEIVQELKGEEGIVKAEFDVEQLKRYRSSWGFFRDRRSDLYDL